MNELDLEEEQLNEKFKRIPIPNDYKNKVSRAYVKAMTEIITFKNLRKVMESNKGSYWYLGFLVKGSLFPLRDPVWVDSSSIQTLRPSIQIVTWVICELLQDLCQKTE